VKVNMNLKKSFWVWRKGAMFDPPLCLASLGLFLGFGKFVHEKYLSWRGNEVYLSSIETHKGAESGFSSAYEDILWEEDFIASAPRRARSTVGKRFSFLIYCHAVEEMSTDWASKGLWSFRRVFFVNL
jgi:hypothetical protein